MDASIVLASASAVLFGFSNISFKLGVTPLGELSLSRVASYQFLLELVTSKWIVAGVVLTVVSGAFYIAALSYGDVIKVVAVLALSYLVTALLARVFLGEVLNAFTVGGFILIIVGIVLVHTQA
jgi:uncharacterized membrane protein